MECKLVRRALVTQNGVRACTPLNSGWFRLIFYWHTRLSGHKVGMLSPKKDQLKPLGRFNSKLYTKSGYIGVRARTPCTFWDNYQFCQNCVFLLNKLWIKWKWTFYDQYTLKGHEPNLYLHLFFLASSHVQKLHFAKNNWVKTANSALSRVRKDLHPAM